MKNKHTNKIILFKGLKTLVLSLLFIFLGPTLFYVANTLKTKPIYIPLLILSIICCFLAIYIAFKGIQIIMDSMFGDSKKSH